MAPPKTKTPTKQSSGKAPARPADAATAPIPAGEKIPMQPEDIGGELVSLLSEGLYKNPLDAFREYIQNSIDAGTKDVHLKFTGRSVFITDHGRGMTREKLVRARRFGVSDKSFLKDVGFRGIGIYSAFHLCDKMVIRTKVEGPVEEHLAIFDFAGMRKALADARQGKADPTGILNLLTDYVTFETLDVNYVGQRTVVELHNIDDLHYGDLSNSASVEQYLLDTIPINFEPDFPYRKDITARLNDLLPEDQRPIVVTLAFKNEPERVLHKKMPPDLTPPLFHEVKDKNGKVQAFIWGCRNTKPGKLDEKAGFVYKLKGFTIGRYDSLRSAFQTRVQLYPWWTGEVYVLNDNVIPTTARDAFENNAASYALDLAVRAGLEPYRTNAETFQAVTRAEVVVDRVEATFNRLEARAAEGLLTSTETYELIDGEREVQAHAKRLSRHDAAAREVRTRALELHQRLKHLRKLVEKNEPQENGPKSKTQKTQPRSAPTTALPQRSSATPLAPTQRAIGELFSGYDLDDAAQAREALEIIIACIDDVLDQSSDEYRDLSNAIEARLTDKAEDDLT